MEKRENKVCLGAYFTVEAACIVPIVLGVYVLLIYIMFYQYDRCLAQQDMVLIAMEEDVSGNRGTDRYLAYISDGISLQSGNGKVTAQTEGELNVPFSGLDIWTNGSSWHMKASFEKGKTDPVNLIRLYRKFMEEKDE